MKFIKSFFACLLAIIASQIFFVIVIAIIIGSVAASSSKKVSIENNSVLNINFATKITDKVDDFSKLLSLIEQDAQVNQLKNVIDAIKKAKDDDRIKGISLSLSSANLSIANCGEIKEALLDFKSSGKFITAYSNNFDQKAYYMASCADEIYMNPEGMFMFNGLGGQAMFFSRGLKKLGIEPQIIRSGKFKSAIEPFINTKMSKENRLQTEAYLNSIWGNILKDISISRNISVKQLNKYADDFVIQDAEGALKYNLIDSLFFHDQMIARLNKLSGSADHDVVSIGDYINSMNLENFVGSKSENKIAILYAQGEIVMGESKENKLGSDFADLIKRAREDESVKAVVLRVNSPGGSSQASDIIWREIALTRKVKPVISSFGTVAASGGYYIACGTNKIIAEKNTITGSIGVFGLLFSGKDLLENKLGLDFDPVKTNKHSDFLGGGNSPILSKPLSQFERKIFQHLIDKTYNRFTSLVANGRGMTQKDVFKIAQGRVWIGTKAMEIGLVDQIGGLDLAIKVAAKEANIENYSIKEFKAKKSFLSKLVNPYSRIKNMIVEQIIGENAIYTNAIKKATEMSGIKVLLPYRIEL